MVLVVWVGLLVQVRFVFWVGFVVGVLFLVAVGYMVEVRYMVGLEYAVRFGVVVFLIVGHAGFEFSFVILPVFVANNFV